jgi:hypothetical protein
MEQAPGIPAFFILFYILAEYRYSLVVTVRMFYAAMEIYLE